MAALGLGDDRGLPVPRPARPPPGPRRRQPAAGARRARRATRRGSPPLGRRLAQLPVDPRLGRMVLEADRLGCADEVIVDRRRAVDPGPARAPGRAARAGRPAARPLRRRALRLPRLPEPVALPARAAARAVGQPVPQALPSASSCTTCASASGRTSSASCAPRRKEVGVDAQPARRPSRERHPPRAARRAALARRRCKRRADGREYLGARGARFAIFPGLGARAKQPPTWVMVAELVETSRLWGRDVARIEPEWVEPLAEHLVKRTYSEPRWDAKRGAGRRHRAGDALRAADRRRPHGRLRARSTRSLVARAVHPPRAGRGRLGDAPPLLRATTSALRRGGRGARGARPPARHPRRRRGAVTTSTTRAIPADVVSGAHFDRWWRDARRARPRPADLHARAARRPGRGRRARPARPPDGVAARATSTLPLTYRFEPGAERRRRDRARAARRRSPQLRADGLRLARARRCARSSSPR